MGCAEFSLNRSYWCLLNIPNDIAFWQYFMAFPYYVSFLLNLAVWCAPLMEAGWSWRGCCIKRGPQWSIFNRAGKDVHQKEKHDLTSLITKDHNTGSLHEGTKWDWKLKLHLKWKLGKGEGGGEWLFYARRRGGGGGIKLQSWINKSLSEMWYNLVK